MGRLIGYGEGWQGFRGKLEYSELKKEQGRELEWEGSVDCILQVTPFNKAFN